MHTFSQPLTEKKKLFSAVSSAATFGPSLKPKTLQMIPVDL